MSHTKLPLGVARTLVWSLTLAVGIAACGGGAAAPSSPAAASPASAKPSAAASASTPPKPSAAASAKPSSSPAASAAPSGSASGAAASSGGAQLLIGTSADFPPMSFKDPKDPEKFQGFEVDMMDAVMKHLNRSYKFKEISFNGLLPGVQAGQINMIVSDLYIKPEREQVVDFVPYLQSSHGLMVKAGNPKKISSYADVCGKTAGALQGGADVQNLQKVNTDVCSTGGRQPIKLQQYQSVPQEVVELDNGRIDVIEEDELSLGYIQKQNPGKYDLSFHDPDAIKSGIAIKKGDSELLNSLKSGFDWFKTSGEYAKTADKWGIPKAALLQ